MNCYKIITAFSLLISSSGCLQQAEIDYIGQELPGSTPMIFAPGIVSTELDEYGCTMSPDGNCQNS